ncbi:transmembrane protein 44 isoform X2 [Mugil cephalus]|uniref:transmembrane protein 44 isoform X2 n=1 Tax=Mugil cephalus TaxID=48193 RepID=UPI001FB6871C|nr:transmembrane protein 44 isoform X2 [Mugil cephalus]
MSAGDHFRGSSNYFQSSLVVFWVDSVATCFSRDANKLCVSVGLTLLSALLLLLSCLLTVGAILSRQLHIQIFMGAFAAAVDALNCIFCCCPVILCWNSKPERRLRMLKRRRRQHLLAVCVLMVVAGGFLKSRVTHSPAFGPALGRTLLQDPFQASSWSPSMDYTEILGYILGLLSFVIVFTSKFPALCRACRGQMLSQVCIISGLLCSLAGGLYTAAILLYDTQFGYLMRVMPWLLSSIGCATLELLILVIYWAKKQSRQQSVRVSPDTERLLCGIPAEDNAVIKRQRKTQIPSSAQPKDRNVRKLTEMGCYMDVSGQPQQKMIREEVRLSKKEVENSPLRVKSLCSTDTSYDSSTASSDLEWDFEAVNAKWSHPTAKQQEGNEFPLQEWLTNTKPCSMSALPQKTECESTLSLAK